MKEWMELESALLGNVALYQPDENGTEHPLHSQETKNNEEERLRVENLMALIAPDDISIAANMVENKLVMSEFQQNMLKEQELNNKDEQSGMVALQGSQLLNAESVRRQRLSNRLWSLRRQSSDWDSSGFNSSCGMTNNSESSGHTPSSGGSSSSTSKQHLRSSPGTFGISASAAALSSAMLTVSAAVSKTPENFFDAADIKKRSEMREIPIFRQATARAPKLKNQRTITTVIEEVSSS